MRLRLVIQSCAAILAGVWTAAAADQPVEVSAGLNGAWNKPGNHWNGQAVLLFHGFAQDRDEVGFLFKELAERLSKEGVASLRINFRGEGDRNRTNIESTFNTRLEDAATAYGFLLHQPGVKKDRIGAVGFSLGASTAIETGGRHPDWFRTIALWSSPSGDAFQSIANSDQAKAALRDGVGRQEVPGWKTIITHREFYESFRGIDLDQSIARFPGAVLSIRGSEDFLPRRDVELLNRAPGRPREAVVLGGADHIFKVFQPELGYGQRVLDLTSAWLQRTL